MDNFLPHSDDDRLAMLKTIGVQGIEDLFKDIPQSLQSQISYHQLPQEGLTEQALQKQLKSLGQHNAAAQMDSFLGGGAYHRFIPMAVNTIASRSEFYTAYTPYQPEIAQGTLQVGYEFQTMIAELTGMDVANASVYDGGVAVAEAAFMAFRITKKQRLLVPQYLNPEYRAILETYAQGIEDIVLETYETISQLQTLADTNNIAAVVVQTPDYLGQIHQLKEVRAFCDANKALLIVSCEPVGLGVLQSPGEQGADIVVGDIQPLGNNLSFGGPYGGFMATKTKHMRQLPGRLVGKTVDQSGRPCYSLTLQTREQHIRREKATSNICTNQALNVLKATVYMALQGPQGLRDIATVSAQRAHYLAEKLTAIRGVQLLKPDQPFLFEFAIAVPVCVDALLGKLAEANILGGIPLKKQFAQHPEGLLIAVTELNEPETLDRYAQVFTDAITSLQKGQVSACISINAAEASSSKTGREVCHS